MRQLTLWLVLASAGLSVAGDNHAHEGTDQSFEKYWERKTEESSFRTETNPLKIPFLMLLRFYQAVFSRQEGDNCQFRPSCSHFSALAIKKAGLLEGVLMTGDRLMRCHPFTSGTYPVTPDRRHHADLVEDRILTGRAR